MKTLSTLFRIFYDVFWCRIKTFISPPASLKTQRALSEIDFPFSVERTEKGKAKRFTRVL